MDTGAETWSSRARGKRNDGVENVINMLNCPPPWSPPNAPVFQAVFLWARHFEYAIMNARRCLPHLKIR